MKQMRKVRWVPRMAKALYIGLDSIKKYHQRKKLDDIQGRAERGCAASNLRATSR